LFAITSDPKELHVHVAETQTDYLWWPRLKKRSKIKTSPFVLGLSAQDVSIFVRRAL
jgi:hypothetical protein